MRPTLFKSARRPRFRGELAAHHPATHKQRLKITVHGAVQGVGFRPFIFRLADELHLTGWVNNSPQGIVIEVEGETCLLEKFLFRLKTEKPPRSSIENFEATWLEIAGYSRFEIRASEKSGDKTALVLPDLATCPDCLRDIFDPANRRFRYPFTNCTNCGPRFSLIESLPYDRANTSMKQFAMCPACHAEYHDPRDRRFHAQPNACPVCGPRLELWSRSGEKIFGGDKALRAAAQWIRRGRIVAVKGVGGFHLMADARNEKTVQLLRQRKHREEKPLALMFPSISGVKLACDVSPLEEQLLCSPEAPIVLLRKMGNQKPEIAASVAPGNPNLGAMLPANPLHHLLLLELGFPVVATSGNLSDEPICTDEHEALKRLHGIADVFLVHNRPIVRHEDDSIVRVVLGRETILRRARGYAPLPIQVRSVECGVRSVECGVRSVECGVRNRNVKRAEDDSALRTPNSTVVLAVGAHLKNAVALAVGEKVFISQHIGDLETEEADKAFRRAAGDLPRLYAVQPEIIAADLHPDYLSTKFALERRSAAPRVGVHASACSGSKLKLELQQEHAGLVPGVPQIFQVQHHVAHVLSCIAENEVALPALGVAWDGTGYGTDGTIWGGEFFQVMERTVERIAHLRPFRLPGGDKAVKEPRRAALGLLYELYGESVFEMEHLSSLREMPPVEMITLKGMLQRRFNSPQTSSMGRLFDVVASLVNLRQRMQFEGQAAMELEFAIGGVATNECYQMPLIQRGRALVMDWSFMVLSILTDFNSGVPVGKISAKFHNTLAESVVDIAKKTGETCVVLSGGCFQNRYLTERVVNRLRAENFQPFWHRRVPANDGGIALGQIYAARHQLTLK